MVDYKLSTQQENNNNMKNHVDENRSQSPFYPTEVKAVKDLAALKEALAMFQILQTSAANLQNPSMISKFSPSPLLLLSMQRLIHKQQEQAGGQHDENEFDSKTELPQLVIQQRNSRGGRARFSNCSGSGTMAPCSNAAATITPRIESRRRRKAISIKSQKLSAWRQSAGSTKNNQRGRGLHDHQDGSELSSCSPDLGMFSDASNSLHNQMPKDHGQDDFAFHSQSSLPMNDC